MQKAAKLLHLPTPEPIIIKVTKLYIIRVMKIWLFHLFTLGCGFAMYLLSAQSDYMLDQDT